jgi:hypothetical protein
LRVLLLEAGPALDAARDFPILPPRGFGTLDRLVLAVRGQHVQIPLTDTFSGETQVLQVFNRILSVEQRQILWRAIARRANLVVIREQP